MDSENNKINDNKKICVHHIGGRCGARGFPWHSKFESDIINILYDADADCIPQIIEYNKDLPSHLIVLPYCVGSENKKVKFNINYDPYSSSILKHNPEFGDYYCFGSKNEKISFDYILSDAFKAMEVRELEVKTLDSIVAEDNHKIRPPDFLSIDTEGTEYEILLGGQKTLKSNVLALIIEVEFQPLHEGQKLFGDICRLLADNDFAFVKFFSIGEYSPYRGPVGLRSDGFQVVTDALFLRKWDSINPHDENGQIMLNKLAFFSILFNQLEYAQLCMKQIKDITYEKPLESVDLKYLTFIHKLKCVIQEIDPCYPPTFSIVYSYEQSKARNDVGNQKKTATPYFIKLVKKPVLYVFSKSPSIEKIYLFLHSFSLSHILNVIREKCSGIFERKYSRVELLLIHYGLIEQAEKIRSVRKKQQKYCKNSVQYSKK